MRSAVIVTSYNRPACLARSLPQIVAAAREVGAPVLVVDDGSDPHTFEYDHAEVGYEWVRLPENRGLAGVLNIGLAYWLADPSIEAIHYFQDDVEVDPLCIAACNAVLADWRGMLVTGHDAAEHRAKGETDAVGKDGRIAAKYRQSCRGTHVAMTRDSWISLMPIPSRALGLPSKTIRDANRPAERGTGSGVDWHLCRDSKNAKKVLCIPGLVRSFAHKRQDSTWDNESIGGEEPALSRASIQEWVNARK